MRSLSAWIALQALLLLHWPGTGWALRAQSGLESDAQTELNQELAATQAAGAESAEQEHVYDPMEAQRQIAGYARVMETNRFLVTVFSDERLWTRRYDQVTQPADLLLELQEAARGGNPEGRLVLTFGRKANPFVMAAPAGGGVPPPTGPAFPQKQKPEAAGLEGIRVYTSRLSPLPIHDGRVVSNRTPAMRWATLPSSDGLRSLREEIVGRGATPARHPGPQDLLAFDGVPAFESEGRYAFSTASTLSFENPVYKTTLPYSAEPLSLTVIYDASLSRVRAAYAGHDLPMLRVKAGEQVYSANRNEEGALLRDVVDLNRVKVLPESDRKVPTLTDRDTILLVAAGGAGSRFGGDLSKTRYPAAGLPSAAWVVRAAQKLGWPAYVTVGFQADSLMNELDQQSGRNPPAAFALQENPRGGTGDSVYHAFAAPELRESDALAVIAMGDQPLLNRDVLRLVEQEFRRPRDPGEPQPGLVIAGARVDNPRDYGRIVVDRNDPARVLGSVEQRDIDAGIPFGGYTAAELDAMNFVNVSLYAIRANRLRPLLAQLDRNNAQGQAYLTDIVAAVVKWDGVVRAVEIPKERAPQITTREDLAAVEAILEKDWDLEAVLRFGPAAGRAAGLEDLPPPVMELKSDLAGFSRIPLSDRREGRPVLIMTLASLRMLTAVALLETPEGRPPLLIEVLARDAEHQARLEKHLSAMGVRNARVHNLQAEFAGLEGEAVAQLSIEHIQEGRDPITLYGSASMEDLARLLGAAIPPSEAAGLEAIIERGRSIWS